MEKDDIEVAVLAMIAKTLGHDRIRPDDDYYELGGDSFQAVWLLSMIGERFGVEIPTEVVFGPMSASTLSEKVWVQQEVERRAEGEKSVTVHTPL